jgi:hypothetical protein
MAGKQGQRGPHGTSVDPLSEEKKDISGWIHRTCGGPLVRTQSTPEMWKCEFCGVEEGARGLAFVKEE